MRFFRLGGRRAMATSMMCFGLALAGCSSDEDVTATGSPFSQALFKNYTDLGTEASSAPAPEEQSTGFFSDVMGVFTGGPANPADSVADAFRAKADATAQGREIAPEPAPQDVTAQGLRARLVAAVDRAKNQFPEQAARAQADYDCWVLDSTAANLAARAQECRSALNTSLLALENASRPQLAPLPAPVTAAPVTAAPAPQAAPQNAQAPQESTYTVYFDFDSWTLTAEDLTVITNAINAARAGGQSRITVVGHTDTSGSAAYNQRLSVRRANVVVEALVDMGARRAAIQATGVGKSDLAVPTPDGVKEARNRRSVITLIP